MDTVHERVLDHFLLRYVKGEDYAQDFKKMMVHLACINKAAHLRWQAFCRDHPTRYEAFCARGLRDAARKEAVQAFLATPVCSMRGRGYKLEERLSAAGLLTAEPGRDWYVTVFGDRQETLLDVLSRTGLLQQCDRDWLAGAFYGSVLEDALRTAGLWTPECGRDWYAQHFHDEHPLSILRELGS